jgi:hypothetical protein
VSVATPPAGGGSPTPTAAPLPADEACPLCGTPLDPEQEWCLRCGAAARTRLAASPAWKTPVVALAVLVALSLGVIAAALVKLAGGSGHSVTVPTTITVTTPATTPTATVPTTTTPTSPGTSTPSTGLSTTTAAPGGNASPTHRTGASGLSTPTRATTAPGLTTPTTATTRTAPKAPIPSPTKSSEAPPRSNPLVAPESPKK